jgi:chromate transporter
MDSTGRAKHFGLGTLWMTFLKIGSMSFGGYMALVSMLENELVERKSWIEEGRIIEAIAIASFLPGPLAVNISTYVGFILRGWFGGILAFLAVLTPSFFLITLLTYLYFDHIEISWVSSFFVGVMPAIVAIILKVGLELW